MRFEQLRRKIGIGDEFLDVGKIQLIDHLNAPTSFAGVWLRVVDDIKYLFVAQPDQKVPIGKAKGFDDIEICTPRWHLQNKGSNAGIVRL